MRILVVAAHPDDEVLGCGGTIAKLVDSGAEAYTLILGEGAASRAESVSANGSSTVSELASQACKANAVLGVKEVFFGDFPDNMFDSISLLSLVQKIERVKYQINPDIVFTHSEADLNIDHKVTNQAVMTAARPLSNETIKEIYAFEVLSSTGWDFNRCFKPDTFHDISPYLDKKLQAMSLYAGELCAFPHPRSLEGIKVAAAMWGMRVGRSHVEPFVTVRRVF